MNGSVLPGSAAVVEVVLGVALLVPLADGAAPLAPLAAGVEFELDELPLELPVELVELPVELPVELLLELPVELLFEPVDDGLGDELVGWLEGLVQVASGSTYCWLPAEGAQPLWASAAELIVSPNASDARMPKTI